MAQGSAIKAHAFANELVASSDIDWISITDNTGGNPQPAPVALGRPFLEAGKEVVIHLTCKDLNRNGLESEAWMLNGDGFHNILARHQDLPIIKMVVQNVARARRGVCQMGRESLRKLERFVSRTQAAAGAGAFEQGRPVSMQGLRRLHAAGHCISLS
jgi:hypothetical protein